MTQIATVKKIFPDGKAEVAVTREGCDACAVCASCVSNKQLLVKARNPLNAAVGDTVTVKSKGLFKVEIVGLQAGEVR
ncbi:MAG: SoxR reducing system RseC family protein [Oscillospiraceae bacterium]|jgi:hypothetical protein|nr:SoxR reducing system RseC family protein [Oscillospiraceae bacterium]